jgi:hypothetical protein
MVSISVFVITIQGKMVMRMTPEAFHTWNQRLRLSSETEALIAAIRSSLLLAEVEQAC